MATANPTTLVPLIRRLTIERFRGIKSLTWYPEPGVNVILGGGDVGKSTILDAIALLFSPTNTPVLSDADYWRREVEPGFSIEAVMSLPDASGISHQTSHAWPWEWDGKEPQLPKMDDESESQTHSDPVYRLRVRGTSEFDLAFEVVQPDNSTDHLSVAVRRRIGLVRLGGDDRNDRDLRLVQGSALDRLLSDKTLRARLGQMLSEGDIDAKLNEDAKESLKSLNGAFESQKLPTGLSLGLTGGQGLSLNALIGLTAIHEGIKLPLASWGAGTRRLAALEIAAANQGDNPITVVDEVERGLEPYRQRSLMAALQKAESQVFLTTHSAAALSAASTASVWYMDVNGVIGKLSDRLTAHHKKDPELFLARIGIIAEGPTECGLLSFLLESALDGSCLDHGVWITDGGGDDNTLQLLVALTHCGLTVGAFVDNEGKSSGSWSQVQNMLGTLLFRWAAGCTEENIIKLVPIDRLEDFIRDADGDSGERRRTLADRLGIEQKDFAAIKTKAPDLTKLIIEAAAGQIPSDKENAAKSEKKSLNKHSQKWFKSVDGGRELGAKIFEFGLWPALEGQLLPFLNAIRTAVSLPAIEKLPP